jgi:steroid delta-isomerase
MGMFCSRLIKWLQEKSMRAESNRKTAKLYHLQWAATQYYRCVRTGDIEGFVNLFSQNGISHDPVGAPPHVGETGLRTFLEDILKLCEHLDIAPLESDFFNDCASVKWSALAIGKNGTKTEFSGIDIFTFNQEGKIVTLHAFWDAEPVMAALTSFDQVPEFSYE